MVFEIGKRRLCYRNMVYVLVKEKLQIGQFIKL